MESGVAQPVLVVDPAWAYDRTAERAVNAVTHVISQDQNDIRCFLGGKLPVTAEAEP